MVLRFFGLNEDPFGVTPEPRFLYPSQTHREALASLQYGFRCNRGFTALIAPPGLGKTTLVYRFLDDIRDIARSVFLFDIDDECSPRQLIASILRDLGIVPGMTATAMHEQLNKILVEESRAGRLVVVIIDEAQNLSEACLETLRLLSNFETPSAKLIHIVLAGQPQLLEKLALPSLVQLRQRITTFCRIDPLTPGETGEYIHHRLKMAGYSGKPLLADKAVQLVALASRGIPRTINALCFNSLSICRALNQRQVTAGIVEEAIADLKIVPDFEASSGPPETGKSLLKPPADRKLNPSIRQLIAAAAALCFSVLAFLGFWEIRVHQIVAESDNPSPSRQVVPRLVPVASVPTPNPAQDSGNASQSHPFKITVAPSQTLHDIALQYLGEFNEARLRQIRALNPSLDDPDYLRAGQSLWLPAPSNSVNPK